MLPHVCNHLSAQTTQALLCLGDWSLLGLVKDSDVERVARLPDVEESGDEDGDIEMEEGWDAIHVK